MRVVENVDEDAMVMAWIEAERTAPLRRVQIEEVIPAGMTLTPDLARGALAYTRGYSDKFIFEGLPVSDMDWYRVKASVEELGAFSYLNYLTFHEITEGSLLIRDGAANIDRLQVREELNQRIRSVEAAVRRGDKPPPLIAVAKDQGDQPIVIEGNTRATAYVLCKQPSDTLEIILGVTSELFENWAFSP